MNKNENAKKMREYYQKLEDERNEWERKEKKLDRLEQEEEYRLAQSKRYIENAIRCASRLAGMRLSEKRRGRRLCAAPLCSAGAASLKTALRR